MAYSIDIRDVAYDELQTAKPFYQKRIIDSINRQLVYEPAVETRNRKSCLAFGQTLNMNRLFGKLRVEDYRVYYDVNEEAQTVTVRAIRGKPPDTTTEQVV
jgi:mRNA-degrading endonuclease RelE of RelBE toxin-antitoxin system